MSSIATGKFAMGKIYAAPIADLDVFHEPWRCAADCGKDADFLLCGVRLDRPGYTDPNDLPFITEVHAGLGTNFDFCSCAPHLAGWGALGDERKIVDVSTSTGRPARLIFTKLMRETNK